jgi:hypothetical protein
MGENVRTSCQDFAASMPATRGLIAAPWTPLASLCSAKKKRLSNRLQDSHKLGLRDST